jgi:hypothetical protein
MPNAKDPLDQTRLGAEALAVCIASALCDRDPSLRDAMKESARRIFHLLDDRGDHQAAEMVAVFSRAMFDPFFLKLQQQQSQTRNS